MRGQLSRPFSFLMIILFLGILLIIIISYILDKNAKELHRLQSPKKDTPQSSDSCIYCKEHEEIKKLKEHYSQPWKKQEDNYKTFRSQLSSKCHGYDKAIITQANTPLGTKLVYDGEKRRTLRVNTEIFATFAKGHPFSNKTLQTCTVVGNGGILANSSCGKMIDAAQFVIRCNLPPLSDGYEKHVGTHTDLVTANPSILLEKYGALMGRRRSFVESLRKYGNSLLLIPAFSYGHNTPVSLRTFYTIEDFGSPTQPVFFNPEYLQSLERFWRSKGLKSMRLSTGIIMASMALELCANVDLYGFWPFSFHPDDLHALTNHYYDNRQTKGKIHAMPTEFKFLLDLHKQGVLRLHLENCSR